MEPEQLDVEDMSTVFQKLDGPKLKHYVKIVLPTSPILGHAKNKVNFLLKMNWSSDISVKRGRLLEISILEKVFVTNRPYSAQRVDEFQKTWRTSGN